jgi:hypothetical protein
LVLQQLPDLLRKGIFRQQQKKDEHTPMLRLKEIPGLTLDKVRALVQAAIGSEEPVVVTEVGGGFIVKLFSTRARDLLMLRNNSSLGTGHTVRLTVHEYRYNLEEIFRHVENELRCQEKSDSLGRGWGGKITVPTPDPRKDETSHIFEVKMQDKRPMSQPAQPSPVPVPKTPETPSVFPEEVVRGRPRDRTEPSREPTPSPARSEGTRSGRGTGKGEGNYNRTASSHGKGGRGPPPGGKGSAPAGKGKGNNRSDSARQASRSPSRQNPCANCGAPDHWRRDCTNGTWCTWCRSNTHTYADCRSRGRGGPPRGDRAPVEAPGNPSWTTTPRRQSA